ncbi:AAHS family benzoate transporter-like MFS transporter [Arthrobacter sp. PvP023]|uniref:MFS transporter n=1 Tax=Micrococcaceae TaxID=1268 RepID=UPI001B48148D|nr:aromatic acid/H+ symport family MFS transporter [Arthrobacter sp. PvP023]MBP1136587.1 AAHS family benzoate transporter-like MFS transporter [Arthrobacter sp. PvP023]
MMLPATRPLTSTARVATLVVALCWLLVFFDGLDLFVYGAALPAMLADKGLGMTPSSAGDIGSVATFGMLIGALSAGIVTDRIGRKKVLVLCCVLFSVASGLCAIAPDVTTFGSARLVAGLGLGGLLPTAIALVAEFAPAGRRNLLIGVLMTAHQAGGIAASTLGIWLLQDFGWRIVFLIGVLPLVLAVPFVIAYMPESLAFLISKGRSQAAEKVSQKFDIPVPAVEDKVPGAVRGAALAQLFIPGRRSVTILFWLTSFAGLLLVYGVSTWLPSLMRSEGYNLGSALAFLLVINGGGIVGMLIAGRIADRFGPVRIAAIWFALTAASVYSLGVHLPLAATYALVFAAGVFLFSAQTMVYAAAAHVYPTSSRATAIGWTTGIGRFGAVFGPWMGGQLFAAGNQGWGFSIFAFAALFATATLLVLTLVVRRQGGSAEGALPFKQPSLSAS